MIRVMHVISGLNQGGAEAMLVRLLRGLDGSAFSQSVVSLTGRGVYGTAVERCGIPLLTLGMTGFATAPGGVLALRRAIREQQPDIVQTWLYHADLFGLVAARLGGDASVAWNVRCSALEPGDVPRSTRWLTHLLARLSTQPDAVLFNSTAGREAHRQLGYRPRRSEVIPNGFDLDERQPDPIRRADFRAEIGVDGAAFVVGMIARAHRMKDQSTFLAAASRLKGMRRDVRFVMVGLDHDWNNRSLVADIDQYGLRDRIHLLGLRQDVPRIMCGLDCLVSTSTSEGFPNVIGEAMACGVPCVATDAGDSRLIIGDTGWIIAIGDIAGVVGGVSQLTEASPAERQLRAERCRQRIVDNFELGHIAARYAEFYRELNDRRLGLQPAGAGLRRQQPAHVSAAVVGSVRAERPAGDAMALPVFVAPPPGAVTAPPPADAAGAPPAPPGRSWLKAAAALALLTYLLLFHSPLAWFVGRQLAVQQPPRQADAIVVFSGNGESTYINSGYQRRARDAARYYQAGYAPLLIISSGIAQTFAEVEIIRALLLSQGVPESAIYIVPDYPSTTRGNVEIVDAVLQRRNVRSILFITAPYHALRASLIWKKVAPQLTVTTVPVVDSPPAAMQWSASVDQLKAIGYECLALAYNRIKGWL